MWYMVSGHNITCDNFLTSNMGQDLLKRKLAMVGMVRKNRAELPAELLVTENRARHSSRFAFTDTTARVSYFPKKGKNVVHKNVEISTQEDQKPSIILDYNATKGGWTTWTKSRGPTAPCE